MDKNVEGSKQKAEARQWLPWKAEWRCDAWWNMEGRQKPQNLWVWSPGDGFEEGTEGSGESPQSLESLSLATLRWWVPAGWHQARV